MSIILLSIGTFRLSGTTSLTAIYPIRHNQVVSEVKYQVSFDDKSDRMF